MPTPNINLSDYFDDVGERQVSSGRYQNASEIVREALRLPAWNPRVSSGIELWRVDAL
jgi:Arc/MetJ-type ribon-helix-helix transcriptional regulator